MQNLMQMIMCDKTSNVMFLKYPSNLVENYLFCKEEWTEIAMSRSVNLVKKYPKIHSAVTAEKHGSIIF